MAHTITGKLNKAATQFQAGESTGFGLRLGVQYYDREKKDKQWTNYEAVIFAKQPAQIQFYQSALIEGAIVEISGQQLKIKTFDGQNGQSISIELLDAKVGYIHTPQGQQPQQGFAQPQQQQQAPMQQPQQQATQQQYQQPVSNGANTPAPQFQQVARPQFQQVAQQQPQNFEDDIPF